MSFFVIFAFGFVLKKVRKTCNLLLDKNVNQGMNYLAHIFLSGDDRRVQIGNFVGDAVKGRAYENYPLGFREGILLYR